MVRKVPLGLGFAKLSGCVEDPCGFVSAMASYLPSLGFGAASSRFVLLSVELIVVIL